MTFTQFRRSVLNCPTKETTAVADYHETLSFSQSYDDSVVMHICKRLGAINIAEKEMVIIKFAGPKLLLLIHFVAMPENTDEKRDRREQIA